MVASPGRSARFSDLRGHRQRSPNSAAPTVGRDDRFTHAMKYGPGLITMVAIQWQSGKQVCVWPADKCKAKVTFASFVKTLN